MEGPGDYAIDYRIDDIALRRSQALHILTLLETHARTSLKGCKTIRDAARDRKNFGLLCRATNKLDGIRDLLKLGGCLPGTSRVASGIHLVSVTYSTRPILGFLRQLRCALLVVCNIQGRKYVGRESRSWNDYNTG